MADAPKPGQPARPRQKRRDDFNMLDVLGRGAFGQVIEVEDKETKKHYAMKILSKVHIIREKKMNYVKVERDVMTKLNHPNIVRLLLTFQDPGNLYYVVELGRRGDLQNQLNKLYSIDLPIARLLLGQILLAVAHMHQHRILHRDLKPENILLDDQNRVKITDFGTAKICQSATNQSATNQSATNQSATNQSATNQSTTNQSATNQSTTNQSTTNQSATNQSTTNQSTTNQSTTNQSTTNQSTTNQSTTNQSTTNQSTTNQSTTNQSTTNQSATNQSTTNQSTTNQSTTNQSTNQPGDQTQSTTKQIAEQFCTGERGSFVGSADYVSPEVLNETSVGPASDIWSFGCVIYAVLVGYAPYHSDSNYATFGLIQSNTYSLPDFLPDDAKDLIKKILVLEPKDRLGYNSHDNNYEPIRNHPFFRGINWEELPKRPIDDLRPFIPAVEARDQRIKNEKKDVNLLDEDETVEKECLVTFINPEGIKKDVILVMTNKPRLLIANTRKDKIKAEIPLIEELKLAKVEEVRIRFNGPDIFFFLIFKNEKDVDDWLSMITGSLKTSV